MHKQCFISGEIERKSKDVIAVLDEDLDARLYEMRTSETRAGDIVADALLASVHADFAVIHAGAFHSDVIFPKVCISFWTVLYCSFCVKYIFPYMYEYNCY